MNTIKVQSSDPASQGPFVIINVADFDPAIHQPYDEESEEVLQGAMKAGLLVPSASELLAAQDRMQEQARELAEREAAVAEKEVANQAEAQRLADLAAAQAARSTSAPDYSVMSKDELQAALTAQGKNFPAAANKADLIALLTAA